MIRTIYIYSIEQLQKKITECNKFNIKMSKYIPDIYFCIYLHEWKKMIRNQRFARNRILKNL